MLARDLFLKPDGQLLPSGGSIFFCPFTDEGLYNETEQKVSNCFGCTADIQAQFFNQELFGAFQAYRVVA